MTGASKSDGGVWLSDFSKEVAAKAGVNYLDQVVDARRIFDVCELAIKEGSIKVYVKGIGGMVERPWRDPERTFPVGDYPVKRATIETWVTSNNAPVLAVQAPTVTAPPPKQRIQEQRILQILGETGCDPGALPKKAAGARGVKADVKDLALRERSLFSQSSFDKAWERLRSSGDIADAG